MVYTGEVNLCVIIFIIGRLMWQRIRAMQMFLEHVLMKHSEVSVAYARRLDFVSSPACTIGNVNNIIIILCILLSLISSSSLVTQIS